MCKSNKNGAIIFDETEKIRGIKRKGISHSERIRFVNLLRLKSFGFLLFIRIFSTAVCFLRRIYIRLSSQTALLAEACRAPACIFFETEKIRRILPLKDSQSKFFRRVKFLFGLILRIFFFYFGFYFIDLFADFQA